MIDSRETRLPYWEAGGVLIVNPIHLTRVMPQNVESLSIGDVLRVEAQGKPFDYRIIDNRLCSSRFVGIYYRSKYGLSGEMYIDGNSAEYLGRTGTMHLVDPRVAVKVKQFYGHNVEMRYWEEKGVFIVSPNFLTRFMIKNVNILKVGDVVMVQYRRNNKDIFEYRVINRITEYGAFGRWYRVKNGEIGGTGIYGGFDIDIKADAVMHLVDPDVAKELMRFYGHRMPCIR